MSYYEFQREKMMEIVRTDPLYQELLEDCLALEPEYERILHDLSEEDMKILDHYIAICEAMCQRKTSIALEL